MSGSFKDSTIGARAARLPGAEIDLWSWADE
jgi:hypothetical protein